VTVKALRRRVRMEVRIMVGFPYWSGKIFREYCSVFGVSRTGAPSLGMALFICTLESFAT
jgi:hypothetical protein